MKYRHFLAISALLLWPAQSVLANTYTLQQAISHALVHNPDLETSLKQTEIAKGQIDLAATGRLPQVGFSVAAKYANNPLDAFSDKLYASDIAQSDFDPAKLNDPDNSHLLMGELSFRLPLYDWGRVKAQVESATSNHGVAMVTHQQRSEITAYNTQQAYLAAVNAKRAILVVNDAVKAAQEHANTTTDLVKAGRIVESDQLTAELNLNGLLAMAEQTKHRYQKALTQLKWTMGLDQNAKIDIVDELQINTEILSSAVEQQLSHAMTQRADVRVIHNQAESFRAEADVISTGNKPSLNLVASVNGYQDGFAPDTAAWRVMGVFRMPLYEGGATSKKVALTRKKIEVTNNAAKALELRVRNEILQARNDINEALARLKVASGNVEKAQRNVAMIKKRYGQGRTILIDLLQSERILLEARNEELSANYKLQSGAAALEHALGNTLTASSAQE